MRVDDPEFVRCQSENEANLAARNAVYRNSEGPSAWDAVVDAAAFVAETASGA
jgi:hypothetical protein